MILYLDRNPCMPRANRYFLPGHIWHITHRCHEKSFLLEEKVVRETWLNYLRKAKEKYGFVVLGYAVTMNHIHLITEGTDRQDVIPRSMQYVQGRLAQLYNNTTNRRNAFWGDRYHATAVESGQHLFRCLTYIDLNMNRAGVVTHPSQWDECGYCDLQGDHRSPIINAHRLAMRLGFPCVDSLRRAHRTAISAAAESKLSVRNPNWTQAVAVGSHSYVESFAQELDDRRGVKKVNLNEDLDEAVLMENRAPYGDDACALQGDNLLNFEPEVA